MSFAVKDLGGFRSKRGPIPSLSVRRIENDAMKSIRICSAEENHMTRLNPDPSLTGPIDVREAEIGKIAESKEEVAELFKCLREVIESKAFKGSHRSGQFLVYVVEQAIAGKFSGLKERVIGIELFGRSPSYDTGEDAIVRVTASDVRKRLLQHYGEYGRSSKYYISLPSGSYIPQITRGPHAELFASTHPQLAPDHSAVAEPAAAAAPEGSPFHPHPDTTEEPVESTLRTHSRRALWVTLGALVVLNAAAWLFFSLNTRRAEETKVYPLPWSILLNSSHATHLITSDPNIVFVQEITGNQLSVSDYANRKYLPENSALTAEQLRLCHTILWGDNSASAIDTPIALRIAAVAQNGSRKFDAHAARSVQLSDLKNDDNFILLGSPRSNPWTALFNEELDFRFVFDKTTKQEIIQNVRPRGNEQPSYVPTAPGWATGESYAIIAFVHNPDQDGHALLLAGANAEGTEAAGKLVTDISRLSSALNQCGIRAARPVQHFELLVGLKTIAGSPTDVSIIACRTLPDVPSH